MSFALDILTITAVSAGAFFFLAGTVGLLRFPDALTRLHALTKADNLGLGLVVLGLLPQAGSLRGGLKLVCVWLLVLLAGATVSQLIARAALASEASGQRGQAAMIARTSHMTIAAALEIALAVLVLGMAAWTIAARETFAAVVGFVAYGLLLALVWVRLDAVDVALTEAAIGGLSGILLVGAAARLRASETPAVAESPDGMLRVGAAVLATMVAAALAAGVLALPDPAPTLAPAVAANIAATGLGNPVTSVLMAFRAMDTLLEKVVLLLALVGVWSLAPDRVWGGRPGPRHQADPLGVLAFLARLLPPVGIVVGIYIFWVGADHPGGAFQGGTILAAMWLLVMTAGLTDAPPVRLRWLRLVLIAGPAVFLVVGLAGLWLGDGFLSYPIAYAKPLIVTIEVAMTLTIAVTLGLLLAGAPERSA